MNDPRLSHKLYKCLHIYIDIYIYIGYIKIYTRGGQCCVLSETCHYYIISGWKVALMLQTKCGHCLKIKEPKKTKKPSTVV